MIDPDLRLEQVFKGANIHKNRNPVQNFKCDFHEVFFHFGFWIHT